MSKQVSAHKLNHIPTAEDVVAAARRVRSLGSSATTDIIAARVGCSRQIAASHLTASGWTTAGRGAEWLPPPPAPPPKKDEKKCQA